MAIVESPTAQVTGGVDARLEFHVAAAVDANGGTLGTETVGVGIAHYEQLRRWLAGFGSIDKVGVEGTGSCGAGLAHYLRSAGLHVVEVDRLNRQMRSRQRKSDHVEAVAAARAALSGTATGLPVHRDGNVEAIQVLMIARRSAVDGQIQILNQMRHVCFCAPDDICARCAGTSPNALISQTSGLRPRNDGDVVR